VTFTDANAVDTTASFSADGTYVLQLLADDSELQVTDTVTITVDPDPAAPPLLNNGAPTGALPAGTTDTTLSLTSDIAANCRYATAPGVDYSAMTNLYDVTGGTAHSTAVSGLLNGQQYDFYTRCESLAGTSTDSDFLISFTIDAPPPGPDGVFFPATGESLGNQLTKTAAEVGLVTSAVSDIAAVVQSGRWALWRDGYLIHVDGSFNTNTEIKSARKTVHAATTGAALYQNLIPSLQQKVSVWNPELTGLDADATWFHVLTQTSAFDEPTLAPGDLWAYSDANPTQLNRALARVYGLSDFDAGYDTVLSTALLDPIGATGWASFPAADGIRLNMDLEDFGRIGLLLTKGGQWNGTRLMDQSFVQQLLGKQTYGIPPNYNNANDGMTGLQVSDFPESPYGLMTWVNTDQDLYPAAATTWAVALGVGGHYIIMDPSSGIVFAALSATFDPVPGNPPGWPTEVRSVVEALHTSVAGPNPLVNVDETPPTAPSPLTAIYNGSAIDLNWAAATDPDSGISLYEIWRNVVGQPAIMIDSVSDTTTTFVDTDLADNTDYEYQVIARNGSGIAGPPSNVASVSTPDAPPIAPGGVSAVPGNAQVTLSWTANSEGDLAGYRVLHGLR
jgi:CubicO group peptidase (beta-lactamase class C family)